MKHLLLRADDTPFASKMFPIFFSDKAARESFIKDTGFKHLHPASPIRVLWESWKSNRMTP
ncbi:MAG: hypothetical protein WAN14_10530 [Candidatus Acidiferrales bacterium]